MKSGRTTPTPLRSRFDLQTFERFPKRRVLRDNACISGTRSRWFTDLAMLAGAWKKAWGLVEREGRRVFVHKQELIEATPERVATLARFRSDLKAIFRGEEPSGNRVPGGLAKMADLHTYIISVIGIADNAQWLSPRFADLNTLNRKARL